MARLFSLTALFALALACDGIQPVESTNWDTDPDNILDTDGILDTAETDLGGNGGKGGGKGGVNTPPRAYAGADQTGLPGDFVTLDGGQSTDLDGDPLTYAWRLASQPPESTGANLSSLTERITTLFVDVAGDYTVELVVNDGMVSSAPDTVLVRVGNDNKVPKANAGVDQRVTVGQTVQLDASGSTDPDDDPLEYRWAPLIRPTGSYAQIQNAQNPATAVRPFFVADVAGTYVAQLRVFDGELESALDSVTITASAAPNPGGSGGSSSSGSSSDCLDCAASSVRVAGETWSAGNVASSFGLLMLPVFVALWQRRR